MALSTRARFGGLGGALALGVLGIAYAADGTAGPRPHHRRRQRLRHRGAAPGTEGQHPADGKDCPEGSGGSDFGSGSGELGEQGERGGGTGSLAPQESSPAPVDQADA